VRAAQKLLDALTIGRGSARAGGGGGGVKGVIYTPMPLGMYENGKKTCGFLHFLASKLPKTPFFSQKYLARSTVCAT
jgi:hypothetical protein